MILEYLILVLIILNGNSDCQGITERDELRIPTQNLNLEQEPSFTTTIVAATTKTTTETTSTETTDTSTTKTKTETIETTTERTTDTDERKSPDDFFRCNLIYDFHNRSDEEGCLPADFKTHFCPGNPPSNSYTRFLKKNVKIVFY
jgi:hypothetical protein